MEFVCKTFEKLSALELYQILQLRSQVFVVEQNCIYQDMDDKDLKSVHLLGYKDNVLVAYARLIDKEISYLEYGSIGRVCTRLEFRKLSLGKELMKEALNQYKKLFQDLPIKISAQSYLLNFYSNFGFIPVEEEYLEDNIPHRAMVLACETT